LGETPLREVLCPRRFGNLAGQRLLDAGGFKFVEHSGRDYKFLARLVFLRENGESSPFALAPWWESFIR
jgi:hypothetical protein